MATKIGTLQADLILKSANFIAGMKQSADATARATHSMMHGLHEVNKVLKIAMGGGVAREFSHLFHMLNAEAEKTSESFKKMHESVAESFHHGFGKGVDENLKVSNEQLREMDESAERMGHTIGGTWTKGLMGFNQQMQNADNVVDDIMSGNLLEALIGEKGVKAGFAFLDWLNNVKTKSEEIKEATRDYVNEIKKADFGKFNETVVERTGGELTQKQAFDEAMLEGLGNVSAWEPVLDANAQATEKWNKALEEVAKGIDEYFDVIAAGIADAVIDAKSFEEALQDISKQVAKMALTAALQTIFQAGGQMAGLPQVPGATVFHGGGEVGLGGSRRSMPGAAWSNAPRFHGGFMPGEFPAILQRGETVLTRQQMVGLRSGGGTSVPVSIAIDARGADKDGLARVEAQLRNMQRTLPTQVIKTVREARSRRVPL